MTSLYVLRLTYGDPTSAFGAEPSEKNLHSCSSDIGTDILQRQQTLHTIITPAAYVVYQRLCWRVTTNKDNKGRGPYPFLISNINN
jgi:hypothetical protein